MIVSLASFQIYVAMSCMVVILSRDIAPETLENAIER